MLSVSSQENSFSESIPHTEGQTVHSVAKCSTLQSVQNFDFLCSALNACILNVL